MYVKYNGVQSALNEAAVQIRKQTQYGQYHEPLLINERWQIDGRIQVDQTLSASAAVGALNAAITALEAAYIDGGDLYLLDNDGGETAHQILAANTLYGTHVAMPPSYPTGTGAEFTYYRNYQAAIEAQLPAGSGGFISSQDSITINGDGGPEKVITEILNGQPDVQTLRQYTKVSAIQSGQALSYGGFWPANAPFFPEWLMGKRTSIRRQWPPLLALGTGDPNVLVYRTFWTYYYETPGSFSAPIA